MLPNIYGKPFSAFAFSSQSKSALFYFGKYCAPNKSFTDRANSLIDCSAVVFPIPTFSSGESAGIPYACIRNAAVSF